VSNSPEKARWKEVEAAAQKVEDKLAFAAPEIVRVLMGCLSASPAGAGFHKNR
jgi:hypothetical protein